MRRAFSNKENTRLIMIFLQSILDAFPLRIRYIAMKETEVALKIITLINKAYSRENDHPFRIADVTKAIVSHRIALIGNGKKSLNALIHLISFINTLTCIFGFQNYELVFPQFGFSLQLRHQ